MSVLTHLQDTSSKLVLSDDEKGSINTSITTLKSRLIDYFSSSDLKEQLQFGSSTRGTILPRKADSDSDIDYMIIFNNDKDYKPQTFIERLNRFATSKYASSQIYRSHPTVVLELNHIKFDLVPAYKNWFETIYIPGPKSAFMEWITTNPNGFNQQLTDKNQNNGHLIKPMIRLVKYWNALNGYVYESFELEQNLVNQYYFFCSTIKDYFFSAIENLSTWNLPTYKSDKVARAKEIVQSTKRYEADQMPNTAEAEIKRLIPPV